MKHTPQQLEAMVADAVAKSELITARIKSGDYSWARQLADHLEINLGDLNDYANALADSEGAQP